MKTIIDITVPINTMLVRWPGSPGIILRPWLSFAQGDNVNDTVYSASLHVGTHIDAPCHRVQDGKTVDSLSLDVLMGEALVVDCGSVKTITASFLDSVEECLHVKRILFKTSNSALWSTPGHVFNQDYVALSRCAADWLVEHDIRVVGIDYLSVEGYSGTGEVHTRLFNAGMVIIESLNLMEVLPGVYTLHALPMLIEGVEAAPVRAILIKD